MVYIEKKKLKSLPYLLAIEISLANGFSQVYIFITWMPFTISFIKRTLSSVLKAVRSLKVAVLLPKQTKIILGKLMQFEFYLTYFAEEQTEIRKLCLQMLIHQQYDTTDRYQ